MSLQSVRILSRLSNEQSQLQITFNFEINRNKAQWLHNSDCNLVPTCWLVPILAQISTKLILGFAITTIYNLRLAGLLR